MELLANLRAQSIRFGVPKKKGGGAIFLPHFVGRLKDEFSFVEAPARQSDFDLEAGTVLTYGQCNGVIVNTLKIYSNGMFAECIAAGTEMVDAVLDKVEQVLVAEFDAEVLVSAPIARVYSSQMEVRLSAEAVAGLGVLDPVRQRLGAFVRGYGIDVPEYQTLSFAIGADPMLASTAIKPQRFLFERRANRRFDENVFFSEAPLQSAEHWALLHDLEATLTSA